MTIYNLGNIKGEKGDRGECAPGPTGPQGVGIKSIEQITHKKFKFCLTDGSEYIIDYDTGSFDGMVVVCDKSILSAADGEFATVSAQLTSGGFPVPFAGELITFEVRKQSDDSLVETLTDTTDNTGLASVEYFGKGVGDLNIQCKCRSLIETYEIEDCSYYNPNSITSTTSANITLPSSDYVVSWKTARQSNSISYIRLLIDSANTTVGLGSADGKNGIYPNPITTTPIPSSETEITLKYENGTYTYSWGDVVLTTSSLNTATKIDEIGARNNGYVKELKIKPL